MEGSVHLTCTCVSRQPPEGVKHNMLGTLSAWGAYSAAGALVRLHVCLALLHALAQERRAYIPQGAQIHTLLFVIRFINKFK